MKNQRPKNLNLFTIRFPIPAIVSILHRISGFVLFIFIALMLWGLHLSLESADGFDKVHDTLTQPGAKFVIWLLLSAFIYHFVAGIRHLLMDVHIGESLKGGRIGAIVTFIISFILIILTGIWLW